MKNDKDGIDVKVEGESALWIRFNFKSYTKRPCSRYNLVMYIRYYSILVGVAYRLMSVSKHRIPRTLYPFLLQMQSFKMFQYKTMT